MAYALATSYAGEALLSGFNWFDGADPSHGFVSYQSRPNAEAMGLYSVDKTTGVVRLGVDSTNTFSLSQGRPSIRLESKEAFNHGLFIADFLHMPPSQCGLWPAFWSYGPNWPFGGEVDIIEGANDQYHNLLSAHTAPGCTLSSNFSGGFSGIQRTTNCDVGADNVGCGYSSPSDDTAAYGDGFNAANGGVYAMEWDLGFIKIWHFARSQIPNDISNKKPDPSGWGLPDAVFGGGSCDVDRFFKDMSLVININFCGDWGNAIWGKTDGCGKYAATCSDYVAKNPQAFSNAYWDVRYIDAYKKNMNIMPSSSATTKSSPEKTTSTEFLSTTTMTRSITKTVFLGLSNSTKVISYTTTAILSPSHLPSLGATSPFIDTPQATSNPSNPSRLGDSALLGCYDSSDGFKTFRQVQDSKDMTLERCVKLCAGSMFAGAYNTQCFCADALDVNTRATDASDGVCDHPCPGDVSVYCGGLAKKVGDLANTTASIDPLSYRNSSSSALSAPPLPTNTGSTKSTKLERFRDKRSLGRRESRPKNMLLTVYGAVMNKTAQPPPPPMAPGNNMTYTFTQEERSSTLLPTVRLKEVIMSLVPIRSTANVTSIQPGKTVTETVRSTEVVVAECDCETAVTPPPPQPTIPLPLYPAQMSPSRIGQQQDGNVPASLGQQVGIVPARVGQRVGDGAAGEEQQTINTPVRVGQQVGNAPARKEQQTSNTIVRVGQQVGNGPAGEKQQISNTTVRVGQQVGSISAPSRTNSTNSQAGQVVTAGAGGMWSEAKLGVTLGLAVLVIAMLQ